MKLNMIVKHVAENYKTGSGCFTVYAMNDDGDSITLAIEDIQFRVPVVGESFDIDIGDILGTEQDVEEECASPGSCWCGSDHEDTTDMYLSDWVEQTSTPRRRYLVVDHEGNAHLVHASSYALADGALFFEDASDRLVMAFAASAWISVEAEGE